jgi:hypothetical protein
VPQYLRQKVKTLSSLPGASADAVHATSGENFGDGLITIVGKIDTDLFVHTSAHAQV